jgi:hypothetical protein
MPSGMRSSALFSSLRYEAYAGGQLPLRWLRDRCFVHF